MLLLAAVLGCENAADRAPGDRGEDRAPVDSGPAAGGDDDGEVSAPTPDPPDTAYEPHGGEWTAGIVDVPAAGASGGLRTLTDLRWGSHPGYERVAFEFEGTAVPAFHLEYIDKPVRRCGSGDPTPIEGDGWLEVRLRDTAAHDEAGEPTIAEREAYPRLENLREVEITCDFEGVVVVVLGVGSPNRYRALVLDQPARIAVDVRR